MERKTVVRVRIFRFAVKAFLILLALSLPLHSSADERRWGTASLVVVIERQAGSVLIIDSSRHELLGRISGLGNLTHATVKFSPDARYAYVIGRTGEVSKIDLLTLKLVKQVNAGKLSVGGVVSQDGKYVALSNYVPGEVRILDADTLELVKTIPALYTDASEKGREQLPSRVAGLVDAPGNLLVFSLMDGNSIWVVDAGKKEFPVIRKFPDVGKMPYDALISPDGRYYLAGFLDSNWMGLLDTWKLDRVAPILAEQGKGPDVPLWKIPHLKGWALTGRLAFLPALKREVALVYSTLDWTPLTPVPISGTALYTVVRPDGRQVWVDIIGKNGDLIDVIDVDSMKVVKTLNPGAGATHPQFTPKGEAAYVSLMDGGKVVVYDTATFQVLKEFPADHPSGIFFANRAHKFGM
ncbi:MAG: protein nirF [Candidatus Methylomirabilis oxygeniifera]|uniref:Putative heme D1 biosynthesis protein (NirF), involved in nitrite reductase biosynthesis n=1 Tax=Methylomirabilis oxygeniifera TaxID=671143 RepID=D5MIV3_METO1|nr:MAG: protein nirF [Candidatus Methylomirabilis oxyfera]CBE69460.1 Putative heme D1 biosynthesis protein (nirF), involved in nitrite reductase biosynthesis [Candidatus Methylomirabilis oxyfera]